MFESTICTIASSFVSSFIITGMLVIPIDEYPVSIPQAIKNSSIYSDNQIALLRITTAYIFKICFHIEASLYLVTSLY